MTAITLENFVFDEPDKASSKLTNFVVCSIVFHLLLVGYFQMFGWPSSSRIAPKRELTFQVEFNQSKAQSDLITSAIKERSEESLVPVEPVVPVEPAVPNITQPKESSTPESTPPIVKPAQQEPVKLENQPQRSATSFNFESIRESIGRNETQDAIRATEENQSGTYFNPTINQHLYEQEKQQSRLKAINEEKQRQEDNKHFEFNTTGNTSVARINGRCFLVPQNTSMELEFRIWLPLGDCEKKKKLDFSTKKLDKEFRDGKQGY